MQKFSARDAQTLLEVAQAAPLQNYHAAKNLDALFQRYAVFVNEYFKTPPNEQVAAAVQQALTAAAKNGAGSGTVELPVPEPSGEAAPAESTS